MSTKLITLYIMCPCMHGASQRAAIGYNVAILIIIVITMHNITILIVGLHGACPQIFGKLMF